jgi:hypothetical protein
MSDTLHPDAPIAPITTPVIGKLIINHVGYPALYAAYDSGSDSDYISTIIAYPEDAAPITEVGAQLSVALVLDRGKIIVGYDVRVYNIERFPHRQGVFILLFIGAPGSIRAF